MKNACRTNKDGHPQAKDVRLMDGSSPGPYPEDEDGQDTAKGKKGREGKGERKGKGKEGPKGSQY